MKLIVATLCVGLLAGCATTQPTVWVKDGASQQDFDQARAQCEYEVAAATQAPDYSYRTIVGQELDRAMRQRELGVLCMQAKGFRQQAPSPDVKVQARDDCRWVRPDEFRCGK